VQFDERHRSVADLMAMAEVLRELGAVALLAAEKVDALVAAELAQHERD